MIQIKQPKLLNNSNILSNLNIKFFLISLQFSIFLKDLFYKKNILLTEFNCNVNCNVLNVSIYLFFRKKKLVKFKSYLLEKKKINSSLNTKIFLTLSNHLHQKFNTNSINLKLKIINKSLIFSFFFYKLKKELNFFKNSLFERRFGLYIDFLKLNVLYCTSQVNLHTYTLILAEIFQRLTKKKHGKFLNFIKKLFKFLIFKFELKNLYSKILGIKFLISGKIKGKLRASSSCIQIGLLPLSTQCRNIEFSQTHIYTKYGTYGLKLWINRDLGQKENFLKKKSITRYSKIRFFLKTKVSKIKNFKAKQI